MRYLNRSAEIKQWWVRAAAYGRILVVVGCCCLAAAAYAQDDKSDRNLPEDPPAARMLRGGALVIDDAVQSVEQAVRESEIAQQAQRRLIINKLGQTGIVLLIGYLSLFLATRVINRRMTKLKAQYVARKNAGYLVSIGMILCLLVVWLHDIRSVAIVFSVAGASLVLALQEPILCIAGWLLILVRKPFAVGDRIELGGIRGDVIDVRLFETTLLEIGNWVAADQSTGRLCHVPNSAVFKQEQFNYTRGFEFVWHELSVVVTFESDWKQAKEIMLRHANECAKGMEDVVKSEIRNMTRQYMIFYGKVMPIVYTQIKESGVELTLRYLTEARKRRTTNDQLSQAILEEFAASGGRISFAYPTYRLVK